MRKALMAGILLWGALVTNETLAVTQKAEAGLVKVSGRVEDASGAGIEAAAVRVFPSAAAEAAEPLQATRTTEEGRFTLELTAGDYLIEVSTPGFAVFVEVVRVAPGLEPLRVILSLQALEQTIEVSSEPRELKADTRLSLTSFTLSGDDLLDLPTTEEELAIYLLTLAGAETTGDLEGDIRANFLIDGFDNDRLPSPDRIAQIIIDPDSLSADGRGPRIEIVTRPGTGSWRRSVDFRFADDALDALRPGETSKTPRQTRDVEMRARGPIITNFLEMEFEFRWRNDERAGNSLVAVTPDGNIFAGVVLPEVEREFSIEGDLDLTSSHRLGIEFDYSTGRASNRDVGGFNLAERGSDRKRRDWSLEIRERAFGSSFINDLQFQVSREFSEQTPISQGFAVNVADAFNGGGGTNRSSDEETTVELENRLRWERGEWSFQLGAGAEYQKRRSVSEDNFNGTFEFASLHDYCYARNFAGPNCQATREIVDAARAAGVSPVYLDAGGREIEITGIPITFTQASGNAGFKISTIGFNAFFQVDRRFGDRASLRLGSRYEATNYSVDFLRINPIVNFQYRLSQATLVSIGSQVDFRDFRDYERLLRNDGSTYRKELTISSPSFPDPFQSGAVEVSKNRTSLYSLDPDYQAPYQVRPQVSINRQLPGNIRLVATYRMDLGVHQQRIRNINAPFPGTPLPGEILALPREERQQVVDQMRPFYPIVGNIRQIESTGRSLGRTFHIRFYPRRDVELLGIRFFGNLNYNYRSSDDDDDFNNPYIRLWGRSQRRHQMQSQFRFRSPRNPSISNPLLAALAAATYAGTNFNFNFRAQSGNLYSITSGTDLNGDQSSRDRPPGFERNSEKGPGSWNLDMTFTKEFRLRSQEAPVEGRRRRDGEPRLRLQARVTNLFNHSQPRAYSGVLSSPFFGQPIGFAGGRTIRLSMSFEF